MFGFVKMHETSNSAEAHGLKTLLKVNSRLPIVQVQAAC